MKHAGFTILSRNYLALGLTLAESWREHHPDQSFYIILVDHTNDLDDIDLKGATLLSVKDIGIPAFSHFLYRYTILELNTAVKPFALEYLLRNTDSDSVCYIDPDIWIKSPLVEVFEAYKTANLVLTPHMREPFWDNKAPSETGILQSGTYNLGFVGLKKSDDAFKLLRWWQDKLYADCIVDIPNGLFVDQKWMDLSVAYVSEHKIIYHPGYNAAYWNLHERVLRDEGDKFTIDGLDIGFFHFSGYSPFKRDVFSKHQNRHILADNEALEKLCNEYGDKLIENRHEHYSQMTYGYANLPNGVKLPLNIIRDALQDMYRQSIEYPDPLLESDKFCKFMVTPGKLPRTTLPPLHHYLLQRRPDVAAAFPGAKSDCQDEHYQNWLKTSGAKEENVRDLLKIKAGKLAKNHVIEAMTLVKENKGKRFFSTFDNMWSNPETLLQFSLWFKRFGKKEIGTDKIHSHKVKIAAESILKVLSLYFARKDLQSVFKKIEIFEEDGLRYVNWLKQNIGSLDSDFTLGQIFFFEEFLKNASPLVACMRLLYTVTPDNCRPNVTLFNFEKRAEEIGIDEKFYDYISEFLSSELHLSESLQNTLAVEEKTDIPEEKSLKFSDNNRDNSSVDPKKLINIAGYLKSSMGMGEAGRSLTRILRAGGYTVKELNLPHYTDDYGMPEHPNFLGYSAPNAYMSISVVNADSTQFLKEQTPECYWTSKKNVGYWLWETEKLPRSMGQFAVNFDEIWTSSEYAAKAIQASVDVPVKILPLALDFENLDTAQSKRNYFNLPEDRVLFGFMFDPKSVLERKNVSNLIEAYKLAMGDSQKAALVLKINGGQANSLEVASVLQKTKDIGAIIVIRQMTRSEVADFMATLDVYVSLHRSEGFGLTCAESMALGKPVVASGYSANIDFMNDKNSLLVTTEVYNTKRAYGPYPFATRWGNPDVVSYTHLRAHETGRNLVCRLRQFHEHSC